MFKLLWNCSDGNKCNLRVYVKVLAFVGVAFQWSVLDRITLCLSELLLTC